MFNSIILPESKSNIISSCIEKGVNLLLSGDSGTGKTESLLYYANKHSKPVYKVNCAVISTAKDWYGTKSLNKDGTFYEKTGLFTFLETVDRGVVIFDELNRTNQRNVSAIFPLLDNQRTISVPELSAEIEIKSGIMFCATVNEGVRYTGTSLVDQALSRRFVKLVLDYPDDITHKKVFRDRFPKIENKVLTLFALICVYTQKQYKLQQYPRALNIGDGLKYLSLINNGVSYTDVINECVYGDYYDGEDGQEVVDNLQLYINSELSTIGL